MIHDNVAEELRKELQRLWPEYNCLHPFAAGCYRSDVIHMKLKTSMKYREPAIRIIVGYKGIMVDAGAFNGTPLFEWGDPELFEKIHGFIAEKLS